MKLQDRVFVYLWVGLTLLLVVKIVCVEIDKYQAESANQEYALKVLSASGFKPADMTKVVIDGLPRDATPVAVVQGRVTYGPVLGEGGGVAPSPGLPLPERAAGPPADTSCLGTLTAEIGCRVELVRVGAVPLARLFVNGVLTDVKGEKRVLPERLSDEVSFEFDTRTVVSRPKRFGWTLGPGGGIGVDGQPNIGLYVVWGWRL
jgi:hypothetical protein